MKRFIVFFLLALSFLSLSVRTYASDAALGKNNFAMKVDAIHFDDSTDDGVYVGAEGYTEIEKNLYLGAEVGYTSNDGNIQLFGATVDSDAAFIPIEVNLKYAVSVSRHLTVDFGIGGSFNFAEEELANGDTDDEWLFGGQFFGDLNVLIGKVFLGINAKVQFTDKGRDTGKNYSNQRFGGQIGVIF